MSKAKNILYLPAEIMEKLEAGEQIEIDGKTLLLNDDSLYFIPEDFAYNGHTHYYNDLTDKITNLNDGRVTFTQNGSIVGSFNVNDSRDTVINLVNTTYGIATSAKAGLIKPYYQNTGLSSPTRSNIYDISVRSPSTASGCFYPVGINKDNKAFVNIPFSPGLRLEGIYENTKDSTAGQSIGGRVSLKDCEFGSNKKFKIFAKKILPSSFGGYIGDRLYSFTFPKKFGTSSTYFFDRVPHVFITPILNVNQVYFGSGRMSPHVYNIGIDGCAIRFIGEDGDPEAFFLVAIQPA